jgi:hypothetical protein
MKSPAWRDFKCHDEPNCLIERQQTSMTCSVSSQWLFSIPALHTTPSTCSLEKELYDRARGVEFLFRLGSSLALFVFNHNQSWDGIHSNTVQHLQCVQQQPGFTDSTCVIRWMTFTARYILVRQSLQLAYSCSTRTLLPLASSYPLKLKNAVGNFVMWPEYIILRWTTRTLHKLLLKVRYVLFRGL